MLEYLLVLSAKFFAKYQWDMYNQTAFFEVSDKNPPSILPLSQSRDSAEGSFHIVLVHNLVYAHLLFVEAVEP